MVEDDRSRPQVGRGLISGGYTLVAVGIGMGIGYWAADWEVRWLPAMVRNILLLWVAGFAALSLGAHLAAGRDASGRLRRRAKGFAALAVVTCVAIVAVFVAARRTPLTAMADSELRYTHELDASYYRDLDRSLRGVVATLEAERDLFRAAPARTLTAEEERLVLDAWTGYLDAAHALDGIRRFHEDFYGFDLSRMERAQHVRSFLLSFASELSLFENTSRLIDVLEGNENAVRYLNNPRDEVGLEPDTVAVVREELAGLTDLSRVSAGRQYLGYLQQVHYADVDIAADGLGWLWDDVERYLGTVERRRSRDLVTLSAANDFAPILRGLKHVSFPVQKGVAEWMGDVRVKRKGTYLITEAQAAAMQSELEPGDVLLSRKNWYLSNIGLPGFWPHAILNVGTAAQIAASLDPEPDVAAWVSEQPGDATTLTEYLEQSYPLAWRRHVASGDASMPLSLIEAVSEGVVQNTLYGASGDFIVAMRPRLPAVAKARAITRAFSYLGRPYDFDFDFATDHALVCTEVVWRSYRPGDGLPGLELQPIPVAGRLTLPANEIARLFRDERGSPDAQLDFVYYLEGREDELRAEAADEASFLETPARSKWDFGVNSVGAAADRALELAGR